MSEKIAHGAIDAPHSRHILGKVLRGKLSKAGAARRLGVSRKTVYVWLKSVRLPSGHRDPSKRKAFKKDILRIITANPAFGPKHISRELEKRQKYLSPRSVWLVLKDLDLNTKDERVNHAYKYRKPTQIQDPNFPAYLRLTPEARKRMVEEVILSGRKVGDVCSDFQVPRKTFAKWKKRYIQAQKTEENILLALNDQHPEGPNHPKGASQQAVKAVLGAVIENPTLSSHKITRMLGFIGNHGVQNILKRNNLNLYSLRLVYSRTHKVVPLSEPVAPSFLDRIRLVWEQFVTSLAPAPPPEKRTRFINIFKAFATSAFASFVIIFTLISWIRLIGGAESLTKGTGLFFATIALINGSLFFLYSLKYYLTLAIVLSFSQAEGGEGQEVNGKRGGILNWLLGLGPRLASGSEREPQGSERNGKVGPIGLEPNLEHVVLKRHPYISVHIPFYNEKYVVERAIKAATNFDYHGDYEVIIADDSTDETSKIITDYFGMLNAKCQMTNGEGWTLTSAEVRPGVTLKHLHRTSRSGFKGGALQLALKHTDPRAEFVSVFDADFVPYPDTLELFLKYFQATAGSLDFVKTPINAKSAQISAAPKDADSQRSSASSIAAVQGYQWHVLNKSENWITRGVRSEYAGSYVIERSGTEIYSGLKQISGAVYMIRRDVLEEVGWGVSITEDFELTLRLYAQGYRVVYTPYIQAPAECVSTLKRLIRQRMRWAEGHSHNVRKMFTRLLFGHWDEVTGDWSLVTSERKNTNHQSPITNHRRWTPSPLTLSEKLEFLYLSPYYLQSFFFLLGTFSWLISETIFQVRLPFWTAIWGWSLVLTNLLALPLMNSVGLFLEESEERDYQGIASFIALTYIIVPFQAYASLKGFLQKEEGPWFRTPKTGRITDVFARGRFYRFISGILPGRTPAIRAQSLATSFKPLISNSYLSLITANNRFDSFNIKTRRGQRWMGKLVVTIVLMISITLGAYAPYIQIFDDSKLSGTGRGVLVIPEDSSRKQGLSLVKEVLAQENNQEGSDPPFILETIGLKLEGNKTKFTNLEIPKFTVKIVSSYTINSLFSKIFGRSDSSNTSFSESVEAYLLDEGGNRYQVRVNQVEKGIFEITVDPFLGTPAGEFRPLKYTLLVNKGESGLLLDFEWGNFEFLPLTELSEKRTLASKTFRKDDGNFRSVFSTGVLHYQDEKGEFREIDPFITVSNKEGVLFENTKNVYKSFFSKVKEGETFIDFEEGGRKISLGLGENAVFGQLNTDSSMARNANKIVYGDIYGGVDLRFAITPERAIEEFILETYKDFDKVEYLVDLKGLDYRLKDDKTIEFIDPKSGEIVATALPPEMYEITPLKEGGLRKVGKENYGLRYEVVQIDSDTLEIAKVLNEEGKKWLEDPERVYPVVIDVVDTFSIAASGDDGELNKDGSDPNKGTAWTNARNATPSVDTNASQLYPGRVCSFFSPNWICDINRSYLRWDTSAIADGDTINSVTLRQYLLSDQSTDDFTLAVLGNNGTTCWGATLAAADYGCGATQWGSINTSSLPAVNNTFDITLSTSSVNKTGYTEAEQKNTDDNKSTGANSGAPANSERILVEAIDDSGSNEADLIVDHSGGGGFSVGGTVYLNNESTIGTSGNGGPCDGSTIVSLRVNGGATPSTATCSSSTAVFSVTGVTANAGDTITIYLTSTQKANRVYVSDGTADTGMNLYVDVVAVGDEQDGTATILDLLDYDNDQDATNMLFDADDAATDFLLVDSGVELHIHTGDTLDPGGDVDTQGSAGDLHIDDNSLMEVDTATSTFTGDVAIDAGGTWRVNANAAVDGGDITTTTTGQTTTTTGTPTVTVTGAGTLGNGSGTLTFYNLSLSGTGTSTLNSPLTTNNNLTVGDGTNSHTLENETNDEIINVDGGLTISANGTLTASSTASFTVQGNWTNSGTLNEGTGTVTFDGTISTTLNSGCTDAGACTTQNFSNIILNKTSGTDANDNVTLSINHLRVTSLITITDGELVQGALNVRSEGSSAVTIAAAGAWTNISTGDLTLGGSFANSGTATFQGNGSACGDANDILLRSTAAAQRSWTGAGTFNINDADIEYQAGTASITAFSSTDSLNNGANWTILSNCGSAVSTSTSQEATAWSFQRKTFYDSTNSRDWTFFYDGDSIEGWYSTNAGDSWNDATNADLAVNTNDFSIWHNPGETYVFISYAISDDVRIRRGTLSATDITWGSEFTALDGTGSSATYKYANVARDSSGLLWVVARYTAGSTSTATYYFDAHHATEVWTNPDNMTDGSTSTFSSSGTDATVQLNNSNTNNGTDLGTITKVEIRAHGYSTSGDDAFLRPVFGGTSDGSNQTYDLPQGSANAAYSSYFDITTDTNAPNPWTWTDVDSLDIDIEQQRVGGQDTSFISRVEIQVTYISSTNYYLRATRCSSADPDTTCSGSGPDNLSDTTNTNTNVYGVIVPEASQDMYVAWIRNAAIEGRQWDNDAAGDKWDPDISVAADSIATGKAGLASNFSLVSDTSSNVEIVYVDSLDRVQHQECTAVCSGTFGAATRLDGATVNEYVTVSVNSDNNDVYAIWLRSGTAYYNARTGGTWDGETDTGWIEGTSPKYLTSNFRGPGRIFAEWTSGSGSPFNVNWDYIIIPEFLWLFLPLGPFLPLILRKRKT